jgi:hypothetical protein
VVRHAVVVVDKSLVLLGDTRDRRRERGEESGEKREVRSERGEREVRSALHEKSP